MHFQKKFQTNKRGLHKIHTKTKSKWDELKKKLTFGKLLIMSKSIKRKLLSENIIWK